MNFSGNVNASGVVICRHPQIYEKSPLNKLHFLFLLRQLLWKKCSVSCIFQAIIVIVVIKILEKYLLRSSILEMNF